MKAFIATISFALFIFGTLAPAQARHHHHRHHHHYTHKQVRHQYQQPYRTNDDRYPINSSSYSFKHSGDFEPVSRSHKRGIYDHGSVIGGRPSGCPHAFCGCALSLNLFGRIIPHLNLAANWLRFPHSEPAPGMVAARHGHVFKLLAHIGGNRWRVWDANSGHGRIRVHERSIAGYRIVNPHRG